MAKFEKALADALAGKARLDARMCNDEYRADIDAIKTFLNAHTGFRFCSISVEKGDLTLLKLRAKEEH